ncbi:coxsackievirus and adenovirus receptor homolog [Sinocyclocheilus anshuiensis]|uniref:Coxsackievirus and adenovirus receptor homolog n=1 Tax=Sinocyclocheilus anshuiensis TaxID=1608454 RepID=A0A671KHE2_9TELE|nr:PREDICTED: coxsackievirus and adenovirus receptor homolog [Sinocyclocheilus anshuiensis]XP_016323729.1 PREDICTED: coxsackievirus and adenovirus receptor homolog [Sinocyclocheilus anshuiensis]XP_016323730.1 PREDICTED: coxsackievirus and adenovirus receptor homolog [Sinocyclocheilus anshuiensis]
MSKFWFNFPLPLAALYITAVCLNHAALAVQVTSTGPQMVKKAQGESVTLGCTYTVDASDVGDLDIEWTRVSQDMTQKDEMILSYTGGKQYQLGSPDLMSRLKFVGDPSRGDATVSVSSVKVSDTATYQCKVKKTPGIDSRKVTLVVLVRPSPPKCWVEGSEEKGGTVSLRCKSSQGSSPLKYAWTKESGNLPPTATQNPQTGELLIRNHSESYTGRYLCEVSNEVGTERCTYALQAYNPTNKVGVIVGAVIGALLLLLLLLLLIWLLICCCNKRCYEKDVANEIREDAPAPESHPGSRNSSFRSVLNYHVHPGIHYSSVGKADVTRAISGRSSTHTERSRGQREASMLASDHRPPLRYDSRYGYPV